MDLATLRRFSSGDAKAIPPNEFLEAADFCRELGENGLDIRYFMIASCFEASSELWINRYAGSTAANGIRDLWYRNLLAILDSDDGMEAGRLARRLLSEVRTHVGLNPPPMGQSGSSS